MLGLDPECRKGVGSTSGLRAQTREPGRRPFLRKSWTIVLRRTLGSCFSILLVTSFASSQVENLRLTVTKQFDEPILTVNSPDAKEIKYGFEGGRVLKLKNTYHIFTSEMVGDPHWVKMRLAHWISRDRLHWDRVATLFESSGDFTGKDPRAALWSPMPVYDPEPGRWNLFYVAYQAAPDTTEQWLTNHEGRIWRAVSKTTGLDGIGGPYEDVGIVLQRGNDSDPWEGLQGTDSFFPFQVGNEWYAFYGTAHTEKLPIHLWQVGLAQAPSLAGPWKRCSPMNPLRIEEVFIENPVVTRLADGSYVAVYDDNADHAVGYTFSADGVHWSAGKNLVVQRGKGIWASEVRTPLGLIVEGKNTFALFYTANQDLLGVPPDAHGIKMTPGAIGLVEVKLESGKAAIREKVRRKPAAFLHGNQ